MLLLYLPLQKVGLELAIKIIYSITFAPLTIFGSGVSVYLTAVLSVLYICAAGFGYYIGARRIMAQHEKIQKTHEMIYGKTEK